MDLSLVVIARNEADRIARCLRSVPPTAERIVVVDASSTDATARVAAHLGATVAIRPWPGHVAQKNHALSLATRRFVLSLDGDEWLSPEAADAVTAAVARGDADGWSLPRLNQWLGRPIRAGRWYPDRKIRLVRRGRARWVGDDPHDHLEVDGMVRALQGDIHHVPYRTVWEHLATIDGYTRIHARSLRARGVVARPWDPWVRPALHFVDAMLLRAAWRDGLDGVALAALGAAHVHLKWRRTRSG
ncbi:MAG: glycosyltransferase family 2 protein [Myxococcota bacterium]